MRERDERFRIESLRREYQHQVLKPGLADGLERAGRNRLREVQARVARAGFRTVT